MERLIIREPTEIILGKKIITLPPDIYEFETDFLCKENNFIKCEKCKTWHTEGVHVTNYTYANEKVKEKVYCHYCFKMQLRESSKGYKRKSLQNYL